MDKKGKKIIFFDIDGTLVSHVGKSHIPEETVQAVERLILNGHVPAIATGRNLALTRKTAQLLGIDLLVCSNGAHVTRLSGGDIQSKWLGDEFSALFRKEAFSISDKSYAFDAENVYTDWEMGFIEAFIEEQAGALCKKKLACLTRAQLAFIFAPLPDHWRKIGGVETTEASSYSEIRPNGVSKWSGAVIAAEAAGFSPLDIVTIGDDLNDIVMVENAPVGIAVGGAKEELKAVADFVTTDIDKGGILSAFRSLGMI